MPILRLWNLGGDAAQYYDNEASKRSADTATLKLWNSANTRALSMLCAAEGCQLRPTPGIAPSASAINHRNTHLMASLLSVAAARPVPVRLLVVMAGRSKPPAPQAVMLLRGSLCGCVRVTPATAFLNLTADVAPAKDIYGEIVAPPVWLPRTLFTPVWVSSPGNITRLPPAPRFSLGVPVGAPTRHRSPHYKGRCSRSKHIHFSAYSTRQ